MGTLKNIDEASHVKSVPSGFKVIWARRRDFFFGFKSGSARLATAAVTLPEARVPVSFLKITYFEIT